MDLISAKPPTLAHGCSSNLRETGPSKTDHELLQAYLEENCEAAFAELVNRYMNLVYAAALRMLKDPQQARDVTQNVFIALARNAGRLIYCHVLSGWLHQTAHHLAAKTIRDEVRRHRREQEAAMLKVSFDESERDWHLIEPMLDDGLSQLADQDRDILLLRYFERKSHRQVAAQLGLSEGAAQRRISRAIERLRGFFRKRGVAMTSSSLAILLATHSVHAAPIGLGASILALTTASGSALNSAGFLGFTKYFVMTTTQKMMATAAVILAAGIGIYEVQRLVNFQHEKIRLQQQSAQEQQQENALQQERDQAVARLEAARQHAEQVRRDAEEARKLRAEAEGLRAYALEAAQLKSSNAQLETAASVQSLSVRAGWLKQKLEQVPAQNIPELQLVDENDWLEAAAIVKSDADEDLRKGLSYLRTLAKDKLAPFLVRALRQYARANQDQMPSDLSQIKSYCEIPLDDALLQRYQLAHTGNLSQLSPGRSVIEEKQRVDDFDALHGIRADMYIRMEPTITSPDQHTTSMSSRAITVP